MSPAPPAIRCRLRARGPLGPASLLPAIAIVATAAGCAAVGPSRAEMDAQIYAECVRSGGIWSGDNQFGGSCQFRGHGR